MSLIRATFYYGLSPLVRWQQQAIPAATRASWSNQTRGSHIFDLLKLVTGRTHLMRPYSCIIDDADDWDLVERNLLTQEGGEFPRHPSSAIPRVGRSPARASRAQAPVARISAPMWARRWFHFLFYVVLGVFIHLSGQAAETGRRRLECSSIGFLFWCIGAAWLRYGPPQLPEWMW